MSLPASPDLLAPLGYPGRWPALLDTVAPGAVHGRVVRADRGAATVLTAEGARRITWSPTDRPPVTGDWVGLSCDDDTLLGIADRATAITRPHTHGERTSVEPDQVLAANPDLVGVVAPINRDLGVRRLERGIVMAWESGATPVVLLTKADLCEDLPMALRQAEATAVGVDVITISAVTGEGIEELRELIAPDRTIVFLGQSGAGKSTLANALVGEEVLETQQIRTVDGRGRHTTTHRELVVVPTGGAIIDTPGLRTLAIAGAEDGISMAFPDVEVLFESCHFVDCRHDSEPGCAVLEAVDSGTLHHDRLEGWRRVRAEAENAALRADIAAYRRKNRQWGRMHRDVGKNAEAKNAGRR